jgi:hypothetical protein
MGMVERWIGRDERQVDSRKRGWDRRRNQGNSRGRTLVDGQVSDAERGGLAGERRKSDKDGWERRTTHCSPHESATATH